MRRWRIRRRRWCIARRRGPCRARLPPIEYAGHLEVRRVYGNGCVWWGDRVLFLSNALIGEDVAFEEVGDGLWTVYFATVALARFDERHRRLHPIASITEGRSASSAGSAPDLKKHRKTMTNNPRSTVTHVAGLICYRCPRPFSHRSG